jgi:hypothetical protein
MKIQDYCNQKVFIYEQFIDYLKEEEKNLDLTNKNLVLEKHHIVPLHAGGRKDDPVVLCTQKNHTLAHYYRYLVYRQKGDLVAFKMRWNQKLGSSERALLSVEVNRKLKNKFWNSEWQSQQGKKGGYKGGIKNTQKQSEARKKVGLHYGFGLNTENHKKARQRGGLKNSNKQKIARYKVGISKQTPELKKFLCKETIWEYKTPEKIVKICVPPQKSVVEIINFLKKEIPNLKNLKNANMNIYNIVNGRTSKMFIKNSFNRAETLNLFLIVL